MHYRGAEFGVGHYSLTGPVKASGFVFRGGGHIGFHHFSLGADLVSNHGEVGSEFSMLEISAAAYLPVAARNLGSAHGGIDVYVRGGGNHAFSVPGPDFPERRTGLGVSYGTGAIVKLYTNPRFGFAFSLRFDAGSARFSYRAPTPESLAIGEPVMVSGALRVNTFTLSLNVFGFGRAHRFAAR